MEKHKYYFSAILLLTILLPLGSSYADPDSDLNIIFHPAQTAGDLVLPSEPLFGYYIAGEFESDQYADMYSHANSCIIQAPRKVGCITKNKIYLRPGFRVEQGAKFVAVAGDPNDLPSSINFDDDKLPDYWELNYFGSQIFAQGPWDDFDNDTFINMIEFVLGTLPNNDESFPERGLHYKYDSKGRIKSIIRTR